MKTFKKRPVERVTIRSLADIDSCVSEIPLSEMFGDEQASVYSHLIGLLEEANLFWLPVFEMVPDMLGGILAVTVYHTRRRHSWSF